MRCGGGFEGVPVPQTTFFGLFDGGGLHGRLNDDNDHEDEVEQEMADCQPKSVSFEDESDEQNI